MVIIGTSEYIKQKFNVGYHIVLDFNEENKNSIPECRQLITEMIPGAK